MQSSGNKETLRVKTARAHRPGKTIQRECRAPSRRVLLPASCTTFSTNHSKPRSGPNHLGSVIDSYHGVDQHLSPFHSTTIDVDEDVLNQTLSLPITIPAVQSQSPLYAPYPNSSSVLAPTIYTSSPSHDATVHWPVQSDLGGGLPASYHPYIDPLEFAGGNEFANNTYGQSLYTTYPSENDGEMNQGLSVVRKLHQLTC